MEYVCSYCKDMFLSRESYRQHRKVCKSKPLNYTCDFCGRVFSNAGTYALHKEYHCNLNPNRKEQKHVCGFKIHQEKLGITTSKPGGWNCGCGENFRTRRELERHKKSCSYRASYVDKDKKIVHIQYVDYVCQYCGQSFTHKPINSKTLHERQCWSNPNKVHNARTGKRVSDETKKKISESRKKYLNEHPDKVPFKLNHSSKESYPEKYFREWLQKENIFSENEYSVERYSLDFAWPEKGIYLEIDGGQHTLNWMKDHDKERTDFLTKKGWVCIARVFWPHFCSFKDDEKIKFLKNLKNTILTSEVFHDFRSEKELLQKEQSEHRKNLIKQGKVNSLGRPCDYMNSTEDWEIRKNKILSCGVDLSKIGWKVKVQKATGLTRKQVNLTIDKFYEDFKSLIFIRKKA